MKTLEMPEFEHVALLALRTAREAHPEADCFEHDGATVRMPGAAHEVDIRIGRETLRRLGHRKLVRFTGERDGFGRGRWAFELVPDSDD